MSEDSLPSPPSPPPAAAAPLWGSSAEIGAYREPFVSAAVGVTALYLVLLVAIQVALTAAMMWVRKPASLGSWLTGLAVVLAFGGLLPLMPLLLGRPLRDLFRLRLPGGTALAAGVLLSLGAWVWALEIGILTELWWPMPEFVAKVFEELFSTADPISSFLLLVVIPPVVEEFLCRGVVLRAMLARWNPVWAIVTSALIFGAIHLNPWQFVYATWIGLVIGWAYLRTRSLGLCMLMHAVNNAASWLLIRLRPDLVGTSADPSSDAEHLPWPLLAGAVGLLVAGGMVMRLARSDDVEAS